MIQRKKLNECIVKPINIPKIQRDDIQGGDVFDELYNNVLIMAKKKSGKSIVVRYILDNTINRNSSVIIFCPTFHKDDVWISIAKMLDKKKIVYQVFSSVREDGVNVLDELITEFEKPEEDKEEEVKKSVQEILMFGDDEVGTSSRGTKVRKPRKPRKKAPQRVLIFDDIANELKSVSNIVKKNRHLFCRIIISTQNLMFSDIFRQMDQILIFKGLQHTDKLRQIYDNTDLCVSYETFLRLYNEATKNPWSFLYVDVRNNLFRENFNTLLDVNPNGELGSEEDVVEHPLHIQNPLKRLTHRVR